MILTGYVHSLIWLDGAPKVNDDGFIEFVDKNSSCSTEEPMRSLVIKYQSHRHTPSCFKKNSRACRFNFPKQAQHETTVMADADTVQSRGRTILLRRSAEEAYINSYPPELLQALQSNMDIQVLKRLC